MSIPTTGSFHALSTATLDARFSRTSSTVVLLAYRILFFCRGDSNHHTPTPTLRQRGKKKKYTKARGKRTKWAPLQKTKKSALHQSNYEQKMRPRLPKTLPGARNGRTTYTTQPKTQANPRTEPRNLELGLQWGRWSREKSVFFIICGRGGV